MMEGARTLHRRVNPRLDDFEDEQAVAGYHLPVAHPALEICMAFIDKRRGDLIVMMFGRWRVAVVSRSTGPGSSKP